MSELTLKQISPGTSSPGFDHTRGFMRRYLDRSWLRVILLAILVLISIGLQLTNPQIIRYFIDTAQSGGSQQALILAASLFIIFSILRGLIDLGATYLSSLVSWAATNRLRADLLFHILQLDLSFHKDFTPGELIERVDGDVNQMNSFFSQLFIRLLGNGLLVLGILVAMFFIDLWVGWAMVIYTVLTLVVLSLIQRPAVPRWNAERQASSEMFGTIEEYISGAEEIRAVGASPFAIRRLYQVMRRYLEKRRSARVLGSLTYNLTNLIYVIGYSVGLGFGVILYMQGQATIGSAYLIVYYIGMLSGPLQDIREQVENLQQATASKLRVEGLLARQPQVSDPGDGKDTFSLANGALQVEFDDVSFAYSEQHVLHNITFHLEAGQILGILGRTGSGKSTLTRLLFRLYDPTLGNICLGGVDLRSVRMAELRQRVGMVTQDVQLFDATIRDNLTFFDTSFSDEMIQSVLKNVRLWDWVDELPNGLDTRLAAGRQGLSAGEAQLLAFGRVFLKQPGLVILDEASSRLDPHTEMLMEQAIDQLFVGRTGILIAHRLKTVQRADYIMILERGQVTEYGERQLLASDPDSHYSQLMRTGLEEVLA